MGDPTIPRKSSKQGNAKQRVKVDGPAWGRIIDQGGGLLVLEDDRGNKWPASKLIASMSPFGYDDEGFYKAPRPWVFAGDVPVVVGDCFIIEFLHNDPEKPFLSGAVRTLKPADPLFFPNPIVGSDPNPARARLALKSAAGAVTGHVQVTALDGGTNLEIVVGGPSFGTGLRLLLDFSSVPPQIKIGSGLESEAVLLGSSFLTDLLNVLTEIEAIGLAVPTATPNTTAFKLAVTAALSAGLPYLSTTVKVQ